MTYDYLIVGAGLYGAAFAHEAVRRGMSCLVIDRRPHIGGNAFTEEVEGIQVHRYGAHIFHTSDPETWEFVNRFADFHPYIHTVIARYRDELYDLPFSMYTFSRLWQTHTPQEAGKKLAEQTVPAPYGEPRDLEEQVLSLVGRDIYEKLVKGYTEKQWGRPCRELPAFLIRRLPLRFTFDKRYYNDPYQGIPVNGYAALVEAMLEGCTVLTDTDYFRFRNGHPNIARKTVYTGMIDAYYDHVYGSLEYRSLRFETEVLDTDNYQGTTVVNYTGSEVPWTRIIEHRHFLPCGSPKTVITREYPCAYEEGKEPYYPVNDERNSALYARYASLAAREKDVLFGGRLGSYAYYDMDQVITAARRAAAEEFGEHIWTTT